METEQRGDKTHVLVLPFPLQGHINPMLQFSKRLAFKGLKVTLLTFYEKGLNNRESAGGSVNVECISDEGDEEKDMALDPLAHFQALEAVARRTIPKIVAKQAKSSCPVSCLVYDSNFAWALDMAKELGLTGASFFTQPCSVCTIYYNVYRGKLTTPIEKGCVSLEALPPIETHNLPSFVHGSYPVIFEIIVAQFSNVGEADWNFFNTFNSLEEEVLNWLTSQFPIKPIGPTIPSMFLDNRLKDDKDYGFSLFKPNSDSCMQWLDSREPGSVVYVSFGSLAAVGEDQIAELARGLKTSKTYFLWVVRESESKKLPENIAEEISEKGLIVTWCSQLEVLAHMSVGCFLTHCGWNSTLEALSLGVPMVAMPQWSDQPTNAKLITDVWKVGERAKVDDDKGIVRGEEIERCVREVMEGERSHEFRNNAEKWKKLAKEAVDEGGSSDKNIEEFVAKLLCKSNIAEE